MSYNNDTDWISTFTLAVTSSSSKVFANGRHQVEITVGVTPQEGQDVTDEQMESIQLVTLDEDGHYQTLAGELQLYTERDERFDYHPEANATDDASQLEAASLRKTFYVSSSRPGESQDTLYAVISKDDGTRYVTHSGTFNASVMLESIAPVRLSRGDFGFIGNDAPIAELIAKGVDCDIYFLYFHNPELRIVESIPQGAREGMAYYQGNLELSPGHGPDEEDSEPSAYQNFYHYAYKAGEEKYFKVQDTEIPLNQIPGAMNFVRLKTTSESPENAPHHEASRWELLDQYGNPHRIEMTQENDGDILNFIIYES